MGVGVQGEACGEVSEHTRHCLDIHTVLQGNSCEGVAEVVESDLGDACSCQYSFQHVVYAVRRDGASVRGREDILVIGFLFLLFQNFYRLL